MPESSHAVSLVNVTVRFPLVGGGEYRAVGKTDLDAQANDFVAIVGPAVCGKSTLLDAAAGLLKPATGRVEVFGASLGGLNGAAGYLFQQDAIMPWKTALDNVAIGLEVAGTPRRAALERARVWLAKVGLDTFASRYPHQL